MHSFKYPFYPSPLNMSLKLNCSNVYIYLELKINFKKQKRKDLKFLSV